MFVNSFTFLVVSIRIDPLREGNSSFDFVFGKKDKAKFRCDTIRAGFFFKAKLEL